MRRIIFALIALFVFTPGVFAQNSGSDHVNVGVYGDFVRLNSGDVNLLGVGGRVSFNVLPVVQIEAESGYNFEQGFSNRLSTSGGTVTYVTSDQSVDVLAGPKLMTNRGPVRVFELKKGRLHEFSGELRARDRRDLFQYIRQQWIEHLWRPLSGRRSRSLLGRFRSSV